jgi:hypothetical protein
MKLLIAILAVILCSACAEKPSRKVQFVVPDDFHGWFAVVEDREHGLPIPGADQPIELRIPQTRVLRVQDTSFFFDWARRSCFRSNGQTIPIITGEIEPTKEFGMRDVLVKPKASIFIIGSGLERERLSMNSKNSLDLVREEIAKSAKDKGNK